ncbi:small ribosomal subunit Rsm22 family protein [Actinokineospora sp. NBRC 105648]|uniref:small ribosomal subunit Rsm22 family protein n=1 Tax=Actinokineospora sp. NBRC 105648 TaxID=3032206 RepID=UPI0024A07809|nr:small ribosomal subunit Rsm22 family protein [Actinokineospora sp. NBRC 105648]GLZ38893.1 rRNA methyltransferase [Actinokineospora sp. NBRC 105648]
MTTLSDALDAEVARFPASRMADSVQSLIQRYRTGVDPTEQVLDAEITVAAYAAYRMPATHAATTSVLARVAALAPDFTPTRLVDVGGGTGAAAWAAVETWPSLTSVTVLDRSAGALALGRKLADHSASAVLRSANWGRSLVAGAVEVPTSDVVTLSYVLNELAEHTRTALLRSLIDTTECLVVIEPGTPAGYERVLAARAELIAAGMHVLAPCPHDAPCPITAGQDWCHFSARLGRAALHRKLKTATLNYEDEKFSYVVATKFPAERAAARVLRHPVKRKGLVSLRLCAEDGLADRMVTKRTPENYRTARDVEWGDSWD